jgi:hypothetical protein
MTVRFSERHALPKILSEPAWYRLKGHVILFLSTFLMSELITLNHGSGGKQAHELIRNLFARKFGMPEPMTDSAVLKVQGIELAFTTDHMWLIHCFSGRQYRKTCGVRHRK